LSSNGVIHQFMVAVWSVRAQLQTRTGLAQARCEVATCENSCNLTTIFC